jgi:hypothetical protein
VPGSEILPRVPPRELSDLNDDLIDVRGRASPMTSPNDGVRASLPPFLQAEGLRNRADSRREKSY